MRMKISYLVAAVDKSKKATDHDYLRIFFNKNHQIPSVVIDNFEKEEYDILKDIHCEYVKYSFGFYPTMLCGFRVLDEDTCEICYVTTIKYMNDATKNGYIYTLEQIQEKNILLEEYYGELFFRFGQPAIR